MGENQDNGVPKDSEPKAWLPELTAEDKPPIHILYQVIANRRQSTDAMVWQAPALSLAAQAFLLTISLNPISTPFGRFVAAFLGIFTALAAIQSLLMHRKYETYDSIWLSNFESRYWKGDENKRAPHNKKNFMKGEPNRCYRIPSHKVWVFVLGAFAVANGIIILMTAIPNLRGYLERQI